MPFRLILFILLVLGGIGGSGPPAWAQAAPPPGQQPPAGQQAALELGRTTFPINEYFTIALHLRGARLERYSAFPDIEGFKKSGKSSTTTTVIVGGKASVELVLTQRYAAFAEGEFVLPPFAMTVNGQEIRSEGATLMVEPQGASPAPPAAGTPKAPAPLQGIGLLDDLFGKPKPDAYVEPRDNAFLAVVPDKAEVWVGEPVHVGLYFYLAPADQGLLDFYRFAEQLPELLRRMRQPTAWEEVFNETDILPDSVTIRGKRYLRFRLHEAVYYPLNAEPLTFPALSLQMIKYRVAKDPVPGTDNRLEGFKSYFSLPRTVQVRPLPPNSAGNAPPAGRYRLRETLDQRRPRTGQLVNYTLVVEGEGNLTALMPPAPQLPPGLELYGPDMRQEITRQGGRVGGRKILRYRLVARQPGTYALSRVLPLPVFDYAAGRYDTLRPTLTLTVHGAATEQIPEATAFIRADPFYSQYLPTADDTLRDIDTPRKARRYTQIALAVLLGLAAFGWWRAGRR